MDFKTIIENKRFEEERSLYNLEDALVSGCKFEGEADGESPLKEARCITVKDTSFALRYPLWHVQGFSLDNVSMNNLCRAALWYSKDGKIDNSYLHGPKVIRECDNVTINSCDIESSEFGWYSRDIFLINSNLVSEYPFLGSKDIKIDNSNISGKYSFQYTSDVEVRDSVIDTNDSFWHAKNVVVKNSTIISEYLGWYSDGLTLINCKIIGPQPLCYAKNLKLVNCTLENANLSFEYSDVSAIINGEIESIKNPLSGTITVDSVKEVINEGSVYKSSATLYIVNNNKIINFGKKE